MRITHDTGWWVRWLGALLAVLALAGCGDDAPVAGVDAAPVARWACPPAWVATAVGGCGPAVLLCVPDGGAAPGACAGVDLAHPRPITLPDGGTVAGFRRLPDGGIGGGWPEPGDPGGPPAEDWLPDAGLTTCAPGWVHLADGTCDPALRTDCPAGSEALPGGTCTPTAAADCPAGDYADLGPEATGATVVHVRAGADPATADGSAAHPYATVADGVRHAGDGGWVRVAAGTYAERLVVGAGGVHIVGVCAARVTLRGPGPAGAAGATVAVTGVGVTLDLRTLTVTGAGIGLQAAGGAQVRATAVRFTGNVEAAVVASDRATAVTLTACVATATHPRADGVAGNGLVAFAGAALAATGVVVADNAEVGIFAANPGTQVEVTASVVRGTHPDADGTEGYGLAALTGAVLRATGVDIAANAEAGVVVFDRGTQVEVTASVVRGTHPNSAGTRGDGLEVQMGATLRVTGVDITDNTGQGVYALGARTQVEVTASVVHGNGGRGLVVDTGAALRATGVVVADNAQVGIYVSDSGTQGEVTASVVRGTRARLDGTGGHGLEANSGAALRANGVVVADNAEAGVLSAGPGAMVELTASVVRGTYPRPDGTRGHGLEANSGAVLHATGVIIAVNAEAGVVADGVGTEVELTASVVRGTRPRPDGTFGRGLEVNHGAALRATGGVVADNAQLGVLASGSGTQLEMTASVVRGTHPNSDGTFGNGLEVETGATLRATSTLVTDNAEAGVTASGAAARLTDVLVVGVAPSARGLGVGLYAAQDARVEGTRVALQAVGGAGVEALSYLGTVGARVAVGDLLVRGVRSSTVRFSEAGDTLRPEGSVVAYGMHAGAGCTIDVTRAVVAAGGFGFYNASGVVGVHQGVIAGQLDAAGAVDLATPDRATTLAGVTLLGNATDAIVRRSDLPTASALPPPSPLPEGP